MTDYAAACFFFDFLMEGQLDPMTGKYLINNSPEELSERSIRSSHLKKDSPMKQHSMISSAKSYSTSSSKKSFAGGKKLDFSEPRSFMYVKHLHHPGVSKI